MAKTKAARKHDILSTPTRPLEIDRRKNVAALLDKMQGVSFQGRNLGVAYQIWRRMLADRVLILMGMSGAMVPAGMRRLVVYLIKTRLLARPTSTADHFLHDIADTVTRPPLTSS